MLSFLLVLQMVPLQGDPGVQQMVARPAPSLAGVRWTELRISDRTTSVNAVLEEEAQARHYQGYNGTTTTFAPPALADRQAPGLPGPDGKDVQSLSGNEVTERRDRGDVNDVASTTLAGVAPKWRPLSLIRSIQEHHRSDPQGDEAQDGQVQPAPGERHHLLLHHARWHVRRASAHRDRGPWTHIW